jgi:hypothetical protein
VERWTPDLDRKAAILYPRQDPFRLDEVLVARQPATTAIPPVVVQAHCGTATLKQPGFRMSSPPLVTSATTLMMIGCHEC